MDLLVISGILLNVFVMQGEVKEDVNSIATYLNENVRVVDGSNGFKKIKVDVTAYSPTVGQTDSTPFITASNKYVSEGYIAISRDLEKYLSFGDKVFIKDIGIFEVQDRMNRRWRKRVDVFFFDTKKARRFGKLQKEMWILESKKLSRAAIKTAKVLNIN